MKSRWIVHKGVRVFIADFSNYADDSAGIRAETEAIKAQLAKEPPHSVLAISDTEGTFANEDIIKALVDLVSVTSRYVKKRAVVGMTGFRRNFLFAFAKVVGNITFSVFDTMDDALEWIVQ